MIIFFDETKQLTYPDGSPVPLARQGRYLLDLEARTEKEFNIRICDSEPGPPAVALVDVSRARRLDLAAWLQSLPICAVTVTPSDVACFFDQVQNGQAAMLIRAMSAGNEEVLRRLTQVPVENVFDEVVQVSVDLLYGKIDRTTGIDELDTQNYRQFEADLRAAGHHVPSGPTMFDREEAERAREGAEKDARYRAFKPAGGGPSTPFDDARAEDGF